MLNFIQKRKRVPKRAYTPTDASKAAPKKAKTQPPIPEFLKSVPVQGSAGIGFGISCLRVSPISKSGPISDRNNTISDRNHMILDWNRIQSKPIDLELLGKENLTNNKALTGRGTSRKTWRKTWWRKRAWQQKSWMKSAKQLMQLLDSKRSLQHFERPC